MTITVKHTKVSAVSDGVDTTVVRPSDWNADHSLVGTVPIANGGTGQATANDAFNALAPSQAAASGKYLTTDGTNASWATNPLGTVTSVSGTSPVSVATGTTTPVVSLANGYGDTQNPYASKTANYVLAAPNGSAGTPSFRALVSADIPTLSYIPYTGATSAIDLNAQTVTNIAHLGINTTTVPDILLRAFGDNNATSRIGVRGYSSDANSSSMRVAKFRGTYASPQAPLSGDSLGKFELAGYGTTSSSGYPQASLEGVATENWGATARGTKAVVKVTANTTTTQVTALTIDQNSAATFVSTVTANGVLLTGNTGTVTSVAATAGTGISVSGSPITTSGTLTITNTAPDQTVALTASTGISVTGTYPSFTITNTSPSSGGTVTSVTGTAPVVSSGGATPAISMPAATTSVNGYLTSTDWTTFNNKGSGTVTSVAALTLGTTGTDLSSTVATGTTTPVITLQVPTASATNRGALSAADWTTFNGKQAAFGSQTANYFYAAPNGSAGSPTFRAVVAADIPTLNQNTSGNAETVTNGVYTTGSYADPTWITSLAGSKITGTISGGTF